MKISMSLWLIVALTVFESLALAGEAPVAQRNFQVEVKPKEGKVLLGQLFEVLPQPEPKRLVYELDCELERPVTSEPDIIRCKSNSFSILLRVNTITPEENWGYLWAKLPDSLVLDDHLKCRFTSSRTYELSCQRIPRLELLLAVNKKGNTEAEVVVAKEQTKDRSILNIPCRVDAEEDYEMFRCERGNNFFFVDFTRERSKSVALLHYGKIDNQAGREVVDCVRGKSDDKPYIQCQTHPNEANSLPETR